MEQEQNGEQVADRINLNQPSVRRLKVQLASRPGIVPFVGAGLSEPYGMPGWRKFLVDLSKKWGVTVEVRRLLDGGEYEAAAELLAAALPELSFNDAIEDAFGDHAIGEPGERTAASVLPSLAPGPVPTTNFDHVLERVFRDVGRPFDRVVWGTQADSIANALQQDRRYLIKLHGDVDDATFRALTRAEYDEQYGDLLDDGTATKPLSRLLRRALDSRTILFVGCSLKDDRVVRLLSAAAAQTGAFSHFAIVSEPESLDERREREKFLMQLRIRPIWYPQGRHDLIVPFLEDLLGSLGAPMLARLIALVPAADYLRPLVVRPVPERLLHHDWEMVGRAALLDDLHTWVDAAVAPIGILSGRGGSGKTRLLRAFADGFTDHHAGATLRFALPEVPFASETLEPPTGSLVVVVDDAHHRQDLGVLLAFAQQHPDRVKLLLASRPYRLDALRSTLSRARFDVREVKDIGELPDLTRDEAEELALQALGSANRDLARRLAHLTRDSPLVTVLAGQLLAERSVDPRVLERDEEFRQVLLDRFQDEVVGRVSDLVEPEFLRRTLQLVAALTPIRQDDEQFLQAAASFLGSYAGEVLQAIDALEVADILFRRGRTLRITPDVLSDHVLYRACFRRDGSPTDYALEVFHAFWSLYPKEVLANLAELDWRTRLANGGSTVLLDGIWRAIRDELRVGTNRDHFVLLSRLEDVAYLQPDRVLQLVEYVLRNPALDADEEPQGFSFDTHSRVEEELPSLLRRPGHNPDYLPRSCDLLWELGRDDARPLNPHPDHAMRVLADLAEYDIGKPVYFNVIVLDAVERWLDQPDAHAHLHSPFDVLDPLLAKTGSSHRAEGPMLVVSPFMVSRETTAPLRRKVLDLLVASLDRDESKVTLRVIRSLVTALDPPRPRFNESFPEERTSLPGCRNGWRRLNSSSASQGRQPARSSIYESQLACRGSPSSSGKRRSRRGQLRSSQLSPRRTSSYSSPRLPMSSIGGQKPKLPTL